MKKIFSLFAVMLFVFASNAQLQSLMNIKTWAYQLQGINISQIAADTTFELVIIDYSLDGTDATRFTPSEIAQIKASGKKVISYISIGEAEDYRYYWQSSWNTSPPGWLGPENPDWPGNYKVKFWDPAWQNIIYSYVDTIINQGFDGIYLDIIDAYYYWMVDTMVQPMADTLMMRFVKNIRSHVNTVTGNTDFIMIPQNAEDIINSTNVSIPQKSAYFNAVNAVGAEDVFCYGALNEDNPFSPNAYRIGQLQEWLTNSKQVFSIEYLTQPTLINQYVAGAHTQNFAPYVCVRALDQLCPGIPAGITEIQNDQSELFFPNPAHNKLTITSTGTQKQTLVTIFNMQGQLVQQIPRLAESKRANPQSQFPIVIDVSALSKGIYIVKVKIEGGVVNKKLIIQ